MSSPVAEALSILTKAKDDALQALANHEHEQVSISVASGLSALINKLSFLTGHVQTQTAVEFPPVTNFMGEEITRPAAIVAADLQPTLTEKEIFLGKVDKLQSNIRERQPETLIEDFSSEPLVLRAVAIRAGLEDAKEGIINIDYVERIKAGLTEREALAAQEDAINEKLAGELAVTDSITTHDSFSSADNPNPIDESLTDHAEVVATGGKGKTGKK